MIDKSRTWYFFMLPLRHKNAHKEQGESCTSWINDISFSGLVCQRSSNEAELLALKVLLHIASDNGVQNLQVYGDSSLVVSSMTEISMLEDMRSMELGRSLKDIYSSFSGIQFQHVYRKLNLHADQLPKECLLGTPGLVNITKVDDQESHRSTIPLDNL